MGRPEAYAFEDGDEIRVNITDTNSSILLSFQSEEGYRAFCEEVAKLDQIGEKKRAS